MNGPGATHPVSFRADPRRPALRIPLFLLGTAFAVCAAVVAAAYVRPAIPWLRDAASGGWRIGLFCALAYAYLRWAYIRTTTLRLDDTGIALAQPFTRWRLDWKDLATVGVTTWLTPTHRGGTAAGVRLLTPDGRRLFIPDVFDLPRDALADLVRSRARPPA